MGDLCMQFKNLKTVYLGWLGFMALALLMSCSGGSAMSISTLVASLNGAQEMPPNASTATASGNATVDMATQVLTATLTSTGLVGTAAHIHNGAPGSNGPVVFALTETPAGSGHWSTTVTLTREELHLLLAGNYYFNIHSPTFPNGEIRGQITARQSTGGGY